MTVRFNDYLTLGPTPAGEQCAQVGEENYRRRALEEGERYISQLKKQFGEAPLGCHLRIQFFPHDFGSYSEVCIYFDDSIEEAVNYAYNMENNTPENWV
jgi:hypothetical protein